MPCTRNPLSIALVLLVLAPVCAGAQPGAAADPAADAGAAGHAADVSTDDLRQRIRVTIEELTERSREVNRAYAPLRRGAPAERASWEVLDELLAAVGRLAETAERLDHTAIALSETEGFSPTVRRAVFRQRRVTADSLAVATAEVARRPWRQTLPADEEDARLRVTQLAREAKDLADRTVAASNDLAYGAGVTEGVGERSLGLSLVGILVVFVVLTLISLVVALIRKLDDGWQARESRTAEQALEKDPTIDQTTVVLIAAACATVITGRHRVRRIRRLLSPRAKRTPWSAQGRLILQGSHAVERSKHN
jgi:hypothetical protein